VHEKCVRMCVRCSGIRVGYEGRGEVAQAGQDSLVNRSRCTVAVTDQKAGMGQTNTNTVMDSSNSNSKQRNPTTTKDVVDAKQ
jgi:hypothetical protein